MKQKIPILQIDTFHKSNENTYLYVNRLSTHLTENKALISHPHKHNFFLTVFFSRGSGVHEIDFHKFKVQPGSVFLLKPGQTHHWELSQDCEGYIFFHTDFLSMHKISGELSDFYFFSLRRSNPEIQLIESEIPRVNVSFETIYEEFRVDLIFKTRKIFNLIENLYIDLSRLCENEQNPIQVGKSIYLNQLNKLEVLIEQHFKTEKSPSKYAEMLFVSPKHLNRIVKETLNKTTSDLIHERIILEAKRLISHSSSSLTEISRELGFEELSYFSRFFKKMSGKTLSEFKKSYNPE